MINRIVKFKIVNAGKPVDISKLDAVINIKKPDKTVIISNLDKDKRNNLLVFSFGNNATVKSGEIEYDILLTEQGAAISTVTGKMIVAKKVVQDGDIKSSNEFNALVCALEKVTHIPEIDDDNISKDTTWSSDQIVQCIKDGGFGKIDDELSAESENPVKNKAIYEKIYQYFLDNAVYPINLITYYDKDYYEEHGAVDVGDLSQQVEKCNTDIETLKKSVSDEFETITEKIKQIQTVGYGVYGKADTTIVSNGTARYIYGTCTIEQEGE